MHITYVTIIVEKRGCDLKENKKECMGRFGGRKGKDGMVYTILSFQNAREI